LIVTLANIDQFSKFFHWQIPKETIYVSITVIHLPYEIQKSKITAELLVIPSKLIGFTWNLTNQHLNERHYKNITVMIYFFMQCMKHKMQVVQEHWE